MDTVVAPRPSACPWPITGVQPFRLARGDRDAVQALAERLRRDEPNLADTSAFGPDARAGYDPDAPRLTYEDHRAIALVQRSITPAHAYRMLVLAGEGDLALVPAPRDPRFEAYLREVVGLGAVEVLEVDLRGRPRPPASLAGAFRRDPAALARAADVARRARGLNVAPYLVDGDTWLLAQAIGAAAGVPILVAGPPPRLARRANDKLWFTNRVVELLGRDAAPPTFATFGPNAAAARIASITRRGLKAVIKAPASAGGRGNLAWSPDEVASLTISEIADWLRLWMANMGVTPRAPLLIGVWDAGVTASPSAQTWIPPERDRPPIVEGLFFQEVAGPRGVFIGSRPADLPQDVAHELRRQATMLAHLFQALGYVGRCCFDAVTMSDRDGRTRIHWIECNARWSGVSIPMTLVNRLVGDWREHPFVVALRSEAQPPAGGWEDLLELWSDLLFRSGGPPRGLALLGPAGDGPGVRFVAVGTSVADAASLANVAVGRLNRTA